MSARDQGWLDARRAARMDAVDRMAPELRALVHDYGLNVVKALIDCGVSKPNRIRHVVETVLDEFSPTRGSSSAQGPRGRYDATSGENEREPTAT